MRYITLASCSPVKICRQLVFLFICLPGFAQINITGKIIDGISREPLSGATVYADQTKIMTRSDAGGNFFLGGIAPDAKVIITYTGYIKLSRMATPTKDTVIYELFPSGGTLDNVVLQAKTKDTWQKWGKLFSDILIGKDMEYECELKNPEAVWFQYDKKQMILHARARKPLLVENKMLGYVLHIDFDSLTYSLDKGYLIYTMTEYFEFINPQDEVAQRTISANRLKAYRGSRMHFARSLYSGNTEQEGFAVYQYRGNLNAEKSRVEMFLLKIQADRDLAAIKESGNTVDMTAFGKDSAIYFNKVLNQPGYFFRDSLPVAVTQRWSKDKDEKVVFRLGTDSLLLVYRQPPKYAQQENFLRKWARMKEPGAALTSYDFIQVSAGFEKYSLLYLLRGERITIRKNGFIENNLNLFYEGFLADNRLAYDLPWDYEPMTDEQNLLAEQYSLLSGAGQMIDQQFQLAALQHTGSELYLHLDKTIYDPGENIWFAAYLIRSGYKKEDHHTVYVLLQNPETRTTVASEQFIMQDGHSAGYIFLPDSFPPGTYHLLAYTNTHPLEKNPVIFEQAVTLRPAIRNYSLLYDDNAAIYRNDSIFIQYRLKNESGGKVTETDIRYELTADGRKYQSGKSKINNDGSVWLRGIPVREIAGKKLVLHVHINSLNAPLDLQQEVVLKTNFISIRWYPEGGQLVHHMPARMAYEIRDINNQPVKSPVQLKADGSLVAELNRDGSGNGIIDFIPDKKIKYSTGLLNDSMVITGSDFPEIQLRGISLAAEKGIVDDSLRFIIRSSEPGDKLYVLIHNFKTRYYFDRLTVSETGNQLVIPASLLQEGLATITVFDDKGRPGAERTVFREPAMQPHLAFELDSAVYHTRSKVRAALKATDGKGNPVQAVFSLACVLNSRIDTTRFQDIVPFRVFNNYRSAGIILQKPDYNLYNRGRTEKFLLIQCWTKFNWHCIDSNINLTQLPAYTLKQRGYVFFDGEKLKTPAEIILVTPEKLETIWTDETGYFEISKEKMTTAPDWEISLAVNVKNQHRYTIRLVNDNDVLKNELASFDYPLPAKMNYIPEEAATGITGVKTLATATVNSKGGQDDDIIKNYIRGFKKDPDKCNDYVCMYNILNCYNHAGGLKPQKGRVYYLRTGSGMIKYYYKGCLGGENYPVITEKFTDTVVMQLKGRYYSKEFYMPDYNKYNPPMPETLTTLYWNPLVQTNEKGEAVIDFYTNDLKGRVILVAEGITANSVISGRRIFRVVQ